jgi:signal recognition particle GTPase
MEDFRDQLRQMPSWVLEQIQGMLPALDHSKRSCKNKGRRKELVRTKAIINSMTPKGTAPSSTD